MAAPSYSEQLANRQPGISSPEPSSRLVLRRRTALALMIGGPQRRPIALPEELGRPGASVSVNCGNYVRDAVFRWAGLKLL